jgi:multiple sugar transport system permease protein
VIERKLKLSEIIEKNIKWILLAPTFLIILIFGIYPLIYAIRASVFNVEIAQLTIDKFVGLDNYVKILTDWHFWNVAKVTTLLVLIVVPSELIIGSIVAEAFDVDNPFLEQLRTFLIIPTMIAAVAISILWRLMYQSETGIINYLLSLVGIKALNWIGEPGLALISVAIVDIWQWTPFVFLLVLAGLRGLPIEVLEAARIDGANYLQTIFHIKLPLLKNVILVATLLRFLDAARTYDTIYVLTSGGPASATDVYSMYTFREGFKFFHISNAAALSIIFLFLITIAVMVFIRVTRFRVEEAQ